MARYSTVSPQMKVETCTMYMSVYKMKRNIGGSESMYRSESRSTVVIRLVLNDLSTRQHCKTYYTALSLLTELTMQETQWMQHGCRRRGRPKNTVWKREIRRRRRGQQDTSTAGDGGGSSEQNSMRRRVACGYVPPGSNKV